VVELDLGYGRTDELVSGSVAAYLSEQIHVTHPCGGSYVRTALHLLPDAVTGSPALDLISQIRHNGVLQPAVMRPDSMRRFLWCINELNALSRRYDAGVTYRQLLELILTDVYSSGTGTPSPPGLRQVIDYMQTHLAVRESMTTVASRFFISERQLTRLFRRHLNTTPQEYWLRLRISKACEMLSSPMPIEDIAYGIGFNSLSGFQRAFKKELRLSPSQYREQVL
jgi:AraC-like DNA-binding protein